MTGIREAGTYKDERIITTQQRARIDTTTTHGVLNMCANNYLGLSNNKELIEAAKESYDKWGFGLSSVRFICGTQGIHKQLEKKLAELRRHGGLHTLFLLLRRQTAACLKRFSAQRTP